MNLHVARYIDRWVGPVLCLGLHGLARMTGERLPSPRATTPPIGGLRPRPRRVLGIKFYGLGNIVMILPVLRELQAAFPDVEIDFLTLPGNASLLERSGLVRRVLTADVATVPRFLRSVLRLMTGLRTEGYDTVLDFEQFLKISGVFAFWTGARERVGLNTEGQQRAWLYTTRIAYTDSDHTTKVFLRLVAPFGVYASNAPPWRLPVSREEREAARARLGGATDPLVVMHIGTGPNYKKIAVKRWDSERFTAVARALIERHGATVAFTGQGTEERELIADVLRHLPHGGIDLCDQLDVGQLAGLLAAARFVVSNDTSVMHLAGIVGTPVVALFGATSPLLYGPRGAHDLVFYKHLYCSPCLSNYNLKVSRCVDTVCMKSITVDEVLAGIEAHYLEAGGVAAAVGERP